MKRLKMIFHTAVLAVTLCMLSGTGIQVQAKSNEERISEGIYIETVDISGMTEKEAEAALEDYIAELNEKEITLTAGDKELSFKFSEMGFKVTNEEVIQQAMSVGKTGSLLNRYKELKDLAQGDLVYELDASIDTDIVTTLLNDNLEKIDTKAVNNSLTRNNGKFTYIQGSTGIAVNVDPSVNLIDEYVRTEWNREDAVVALSAEITEPKGSEEELAQIKDVLGSYSTNFTSSTSGRATNIRVAAERIDGTVLYPGEEFSVNKTILPRTAANGYEKASAYVSGQTVQAYGGGVCQVSTTLYNAVILAELEVTARQNHSMTVSYVPLAMDAAIAGDYLDFKFKNNLDYPIYLEGYTSGSNLYFNIYGVETRPSNRTIEFETVVLSSEDPGTQFTAVELPMGSVTRTQSKHIGYRTQLWKIVKENGVEVSRTKFNNSTYKPSPQILAVGIATDDADLRNEVYNAIVTGDAATIYDALYWSYPAAAAAVLQ